MLVRSEIPNKKKSRKKIFVKTFTKKVAIVLFRGISVKGNSLQAK